MGLMGYEYAFGDSGPMTTECASMSQACVKGTLTPANPPSYSYYGAALGISLGPAVPANPGGDPTPVQLTGAGVTIKLSNLPTQGARLVLTAGETATVKGTDYCANITTNPATIPWSGFNTKCYDSPPDGVALTAAPTTPHLQISVPSGAAAGSFDFCVETLTWQ